MRQDGCEWGLIVFWMSKCYDGDYVLVDRPAK